MSSLHREILGLFLARLELIEKQIETLNGYIAKALHGHEGAVQRLPAVPGFGIDSAQQVVAEVGPPAGTFASPAGPASWAAARPGPGETPELPHTHPLPLRNHLLPPRPHQHP